MQKKFAGILQLGTVLLITLIFSTGCKKESKSNKDAVTFPHALFIGTDKGEVWNTNDGVNFRSYFTVDNTFVYDVITAKENMFYANDFVYRFEDEDNGNLVYPKGTSIGAYNTYLNNLLYSEEEGRIYVPLQAGSPMAWSSDMGATWNFYTSSDSFSNGPSHADNALTIEEVENTGIYYIDEDRGVYSKPYGGGFWTKRSISNLSLDPTGINLMTSTGDKLVFWNVFATLVNQKVQIVDPRTHAVVKEVVAPDVSAIYTIVPRDKDYVYLCTAQGLFGLDLNTLIYKVYTSDIEGRQIYDVSTQTTTFRSGNKHSYLYAATNDGLFVSDDNGESFAKVFNGVITSLSD